MGKALVLAFYITICCVAFIISKIVISVLIYKRWKKKHLVHEDGLSGMLENSMKTLSFTHLRAYLL